MTINSCFICNKFSVKMLLKNVSEKTIADRIFKNIVWSQKGCSIHSELLPKILAVEDVITTGWKTSLMWPRDCLLQNLKRKTTLDTTNWNLAIAYIWPVYLQKIIHLEVWSPWTNLMYLFCVACTSFSIFLLRLGNQATQAWLIVGITAGIACIEN